MDYHISTRYSQLTNIQEKSRAYQKDPELIYN